MSNLSFNLVERDGGGHFAFDVHVTVVVVGFWKIDLKFCFFCWDMAWMAYRVGLAAILIAEDSRTFVY